MVMQGREGVAVTTPRKGDEMDGTLIRIDKNGTKYFQSYACRKCGGKGYLYGYEHIDGARCWKCGTTGRAQRPYTWKEYAPEYAQKLADRRREKEIAKAPETNKKLFEQWGFSTDGKAFIVLGDTFNIKDELKAAGAKFSDSLGWYFAEKNDNFVGFEISISDVAEKNDLGVWQMFRSYEVFELIKEMKDARAPKTASEYVGAIGDKLTTTATLASVHTYETHFTYYGETNYIYKFVDEKGNSIVWKTSTFQEIEEGKAYEITGKIKEHNEYKGDKQTVLTRCKIK